MQEPLAVVGDAREVAVPPHVGPPRPVRLEVALGSLNSPRVMPGHGFVHTSSPTSPRTGWPSSSNTSTAMPSDGPPSEHGVIGCTTCGDRKHAPTSVPPEMLITGHRPPPTTSKYHRHGASFHGSPVDAEDAQRRQVVRAHRRVAVRHQRADQRRRHAEHVDAVALDERPQPVGVGEVGRAVVQHERAAVGERADDLPRAHDPADVGEPEQPLARAQVGLERDLFGDLHEEAAVHVHRALGPAGRAARVRDEQRMLAVDDDARRTIGGRAESASATSRPACIGVSVRPSRGTTTTVCTLGRCATAASAISFIGTTLPRR